MTSEYQEREYLLPAAYETVANWRFTSWPTHGTHVPVYSDHPQGFTSEGKHGPYLFACKRRLHRGVYASFTATLIAAALTVSPQRKLVLFVGSEPYGLEDAIVFDARRVANQAERRTHVDSKRERDVPIFDVSAKAHGIPLGDHVSGRTQLPGPDGDGTHATVLREYGVTV